MTRVKKQKWTATELQAIKGVTIKDTKAIKSIALRLGRSFNSVYAQAWKVKQGIKRKRKLPKRGKAYEAVIASKRKQALPSSAVKVSNEGGYLIVKGFTEVIVSKGELRVKL